MSDRKFLSSVEALGLDRPGRERDGDAQSFGGTDRDFGANGFGTFNRSTRTLKTKTLGDPNFARAMLRWSSLILLALQKLGNGTTAAQLFTELETMRGQPPELDEVFAVLKALNSQGALTQRDGTFELTPTGRAQI